MPSHEARAAGEGGAGTGAFLQGMSGFLGPRWGWERGWLPDTFSD